MIEELFNSKCIKKGGFKLKNGEISEYYFDLKNVISYPKLLAKIGDELYKKFNDFDIICGIPYGGLPIATYISITYNKPMIYIRDKPKKYGCKNLIEGEFKKTDRCIIVDDVLTTGNSIKEVYDILNTKLNIIDIAVVINRQNENEIKKLFYPVKYLLTKDDIVKHTYQ